MCRAMELARHFLQRRVGSLRLVACSLAIVLCPLHLGAEVLSFTCQWNDSDPAYVVEFSVDIAGGAAVRNDADLKYRVLQANQFGIWLQSEAALRGETAVITSFARSSVGGKWSDTWIWSDGRVSQTTGGYCVEVSK